MSSSFSAGCRTVVVSGWWHPVPLIRLLCALLVQPVIYAAARTACVAFGPALIPGLCKGITKIYLGLGRPVLYAWCASKMLPTAHVTIYVQHCGEPLHSIKRTARTLFYLAERFHFRALAKYLSYLLSPCPS